MSSSGGRLSRRERKLAAEKARKAAEVKRRELHLVASSKYEALASIPEAVALASDGTTGLTLAPSRVAADDAVSVEATAPPISERHLRAAAVAVMSSSVAEDSFVAEDEAPEDPLSSLNRFLERLEVDEENDEAAIITDAKPHHRSRRQAVRGAEASAERATLLNAFEHYMSQARELRVSDRFTAAVRNAESKLWRLHGNAGVPPFVKPIRVESFNYDRRSWESELRYQAAHNMEFTRALESVLREQIRGAARWRFAERLWLSRFSAESARDLLDNFALGEAELKQASRELARVRGPDQQLKRFYLYNTRLDGATLIFEEATSEGAQAWHTMRCRLLLVQSHLARVLQQMFGV